MQEDLKSYQVAVLSFPEKIETIEYKEVANSCGEILANVGMIMVTSGDNGIITSSLEGAKKKGGKVIGIFPSHITTKHPWLFDSIVNTGLNKSQNIGIILRSCIGVIIIGQTSEANNMSILHTKEVPILFLEPDTLSSEPHGNKIPESSGISSLPVFTDVLDAISYLLSENLKKSIIDPREFFQKGIMIRNISYPLGNDGSYLESAECFLMGAISSLALKDELLWNECMANYYNSKGDHFYYHVEDYFIASSFYFKAIIHLQNISSKVEPERERLYYYLLSIIVENVALGLSKVGDIKIAKKLAIHAARNYANAMRFSTKDTLMCYKHTISGLKGWAYYLEAKEKVSEGKIDVAEILLSKAKELYGKALKYQPRWKESGFSDNFSITEKEIDELENSLKEIIQKGD